MTAEMTREKMRTTLQMKKQHMRKMQILKCALQKVHAYEPR